MHVFAGQKLRVVMNTNDPDYEHIYSIETYDDDAPMVEIADYDTTVNKSQGMPSFFAIEKQFVCSCVCRRSIIYGHFGRSNHLF